MASNPITEVIGELFSHHGRSLPYAEGEAIRAATSLTELHEVLGSCGVHPLLEQSTKELIRRIEDGERAPRSQRVATVGEAIMRLTQRDPQATYILTHMSDSYFIGPIIAHDPHEVQLREGEFIPRTTGEVTVYLK